MAPVYRREVGLQPASALALLGESIYPADMTAISRQADQILRSMTGDGGFRVLTIVTTQTVRDAVAAQEARGNTVQWLGELITCAALVREVMAPDRRVQILIKDASARTQLVADAHPRGWCRGLVNPGARERPDMGQNAIMEVIYTLPNDILQQGIVQLPDGADASVGLMTYMQESEQIASMVAVRTLVAGDVDGAGQIVASGGYMVQILPGVEREALARMTQQLAGFGRLDEVLAGAALSVDSLRAAVLGDIDSREMARSYVTFGCNCDRARIIAGVASLPAADIAELAASDEALEVKCESCGRVYQIAPEDLHGLERSKRGRDTGLKPN